MSHLLFRLGRAAARRPWTVVGAWAAAAALVVVGAVALGADLEDSWAVPGLDSQRAADLLAATGSDQAGITAQVVLTPRRAGETFAAARARAALDEVRSAVADLPNVIGTSEPAASISPDGRVALVRVQYRVFEELSRADLDRLKALASTLALHPVVQVEMGGELFFTFEEPEQGVAEMIGLVAAGIILLVAFGSLVAMGLPIAMALFGLALGISAMPLITYLVDIPSWAPQMATMIGIGVGIDYALFLVTRHREHLAEGMTIDEAAGRAVATAGKAVIFAGGTVVIAILGLAVAGIPFMTAAGIATSVIVLIMVVTSVTLLPALLGLAGHRINGLRRRPRPTVERRSHRDGWQRWGTHVTGHAWSYAIGTTLLLLALTAPVLSLRLGFPDEGTLPESRSERRAYDLVAGGFGPGINGPLVIAIDISEDPGVVAPLADAVRGDAGIAAVAPPDVSAARGVATLVALPTTAPQDAATLETIERLRTEVLPGVLDGRPARAHVGGQTAAWGDMGTKVAGRLLPFVVAVIALSFLLLTVLFRSVLVPLKAALLNLLSIGAAYGVLVMVFQWGWGASVIGLQSTVPVVSFIPMFMFAVLFGLSMDYEVFLLSRVREEYLATGDNDASVIGGIARTARVITSAALIMISVFLGFVLADDPAIKMMGLGLATAILVDATVVRVVLVPATMKLLGDANWWIPGWLDRLLPRLDLDDDSWPSGDDDQARRPLVERADVVVGAVEGDRHGALGRDRLLEGAVVGGHGVGEVVATLPPDVE